ncbi:hypothetical protein DNV77_22680 [Salmonella enterica subsp. enterica]|nr:hypothetical protein [Salmonella enterica subsp. enterica]
MNNRFVHCIPAWPAQALPNRTTPDDPIFISVTLAHSLYEIPSPRVCQVTFWIERPAFVTLRINILRHSRRFFRCACKALLPAAP